MKLRGKHVKSTIIMIPTILVVLYLAVVCRRRISTGPPSNVTHIEEQQNRKQYDVLINSYMRSGSSFLGQLVGFRQNTFYWYEPIWNFVSAWYYVGQDELCNGRNVCLPLNSITTKLRLKRILRMLNHIYGCTFSELARHAVNESMTPAHSGPSWDAYMNCRERGHAFATCINRLRTSCKQAKHRVTKVVRTTVDILNELLENQPNLKVIHLMRDPRAIINSRVTTTWYDIDKPEVDESEYTRDVESLCQRMGYDLEASKGLKNKYKDRFALIMYEDLLNGIDHNARVLYTYLGMDARGLHVHLKSLASNIKNDHSSHVKPSNDFVNWWRSELSYKGVEIVQETCGLLLMKLGYTVFKSPDDVRNASIRSFDFKKALLIENLNRNNISYDDI